MSKSLKNIQNSKKNKIDENKTRNSLKKFLRDQKTKNRNFAKALTSNISCQI